MSPDQLSTLLHEDRMTDPIRLLCVNETPGNRGSRALQIGHAMVPDDAIRAIVERAKAMGLLPTAEQSPAALPWRDHTKHCVIDDDPKPVPTTQQSSAVQPAAPADDEATVMRLYDIGDGFGEHEWCYAGAKRIFDFIRRGEVPGLPSPDEHAALMAEVERLREDVAQRIYERDHYIDQCNRWIAERDTLKAEVERLRARVATLIETAPPGHPDHSCGGPQEACMQPGCQECGMPTMEQAIAARAERAEAVQLVKRARRITDRWGLLEFGECAGWEKDADAYIAKHGDMP